MDSKYRPTSFSVLLIFLLIPLTLSEGETKVWINQVDGYSKLVPCAQDPLSTIVRGMASGCGDDNSYTSYTCFCTGSSSKMNTIISKAVSTTCQNSSALQQVSSALDVFDQYCAIGVAAGTTIGSLHSASVTAAATATPAASSAVATQTANAGGASSSDSSRTTAVAAGVAVPVGTIALALGAFFLYRARKQKAEHAEGGHGDKKMYEADAAAVNGGAIGELPPEQRFEVPGESAQRHELDSDPKGPGVLEKDGDPVISEMDAERRR